MAALTVSRRGRRPLMPSEAVLERIRKLSRREAGLFRVHRTHGALYARARRQFGSWAAALSAGPGAQPGGIPAPAENLARLLGVRVTLIDAGGRFDRRHRPPTSPDVPSPGEDGCERAPLQPVPE